MAPVSRRALAVGFAARVLVETVAPGVAAYFPRVRWISWAVHCWGLGNAFRHVPCLGSIPRDWALSRRRTDGPLGHFLLRGTALRYPNGEVLQEKHREKGERDNWGHVSHGLRRSAGPDM